MARRTWFLALAAALAGGCRDDEAVPPPGAQGPIVIQQWGDPGQPPVTVIGETVRQHGTGIQDMKLELSPVLVRLPSRDGTLFIAGPRALYEAIQGDVGAARLTLDGPVMLSGVLRDAPLIGRASSASFDPAQHSVALSDLQFAWEGATQRSPQAVVTAEQLHMDHSVRENSPAAVLACLAALPRPLRFPEIRHGELAQAVGAAAPAASTGSPKP